MLFLKRCREPIAAALVIPPTFVPVKRLVAPRPIREPELASAGHRRQAHPVERADVDRLGQEEFGAEVLLDRPLSSRRQS